MVGVAEHKALRDGYNPTDPSKKAELVKAVKGELREIVQRYLDGKRADGKLPGLSSSQAIRKNPVASAATSKLWAPS